MKRSRCMFIAAGVCALAFSPLAAAQEMEHEHEVGAGGEVTTETETEAGTETGAGVEAEVETQTTPAEAVPPAATPPPPAPAPVYVEPETTINIEEERAQPVIVERRGEPDLVTPFGMAVTLGGGVRGFVEEDARDRVDEGGAWDARVLFGSRTIVGFEAAYVGSASDVEALGLDPDAALMSHGVEGALRLHFLQGMWQPYILAGAGWAHYSVTNEDFNTSDVAGGDDLVQFPLGAGIAFRYDGFVVDARGVYRPTAEAEIITVDDGNMPTWQGDLTAGVEF